MDAMNHSFQFYFDAVDYLESEFHLDFTQGIMHIINTLVNIDHLSAVQNYAAPAVSVEARLELLTARIGGKHAGAK